MDKITWKTKAKRILTYLFAPRTGGAFVKLDELAPNVAFRLCIPCGMVYRKEKDAFTAKRCPSCRKLNGKKLFIEAIP